MNVSAYIFGDDAVESLMSDPLTPPLALVRYDGSFIWTEQEGPSIEARRLIVNTKPERYTFYAPRLISASNRHFLFSGVTEGGPSGTLRSNTRYFILLKLV